MKPRVQNPHFLQGFTKELVKKLVVMALLAMPAILQAQTETGAGIQARVLNPTGFIKPGEFFYFQVELENPGDSEITITGVSGGGHYIEYEGYSPGWGTGYPSQSGPLPSPYQLIEGNFPLPPGETLTLEIRNNGVPADAPDGASIKLITSYLTLTGTDNTGLPLPPLYIDKTPLRIISASGTGDESVFAGINLDSKFSGLSYPQLETSLVYPSQIEAGEHFKLTARIKNLGSTAIELIRNHSPGVNLDFHNQTLFNYQACQTDCILVGNLPLLPQQELLLDLGTFYYDDPVLKPAHLQIQSLSVQLFDENQRRMRQFFDIDVSINGPQVTGAPNPEFALPSGKLPLQSTDLAEAGDGLLIHDPNTGNDWVKLTETVMLEDPEAMLAEGGRFQGFKLANTAQVETLLRNHLFSEGHNLREQRSVLPVISNNVTDSILTFMNKMGVTYTENAMQSARGYVRDIKYHDSIGKSRTIANISHYDEGVTYYSLFPGLSETLSGPDFTPELAGIGFWLVRRPADAPTPLASISSFLNDELHIPLITAEGQHYRVVLDRIDPVSNRLRLVSTEPVGTVDAQAVQFQSDTNTLEIPEAVLLDAESEEMRFQLRLELIEGSDPAVFNVIELKPLAGQ